MYNLLLDCNLHTCTSGVDGFTQKEITQAQMEALAARATAITVTSGQYIAATASLSMDMVCERANLYCDVQVSGVAQVWYKEFLYNEVYSHGAYNYNTDFSTPEMLSNLYPEPYSCSESSYYVGLEAWHAFNKTYDDSYDCWHSDLTGFPHSIMFHFPYGKVVNKYALQCRNHTPDTSRHFPKDFQLQGNIVSDPDITNDAHWETLDSRTGIADPGRSAWSDYFTFENAKSYNYYRLKVTNATTASNCTAIANIKLVEANRAEWVPVYLWTKQDMVWDTDHYTLDIPVNVGIEEAVLLLGTASGSVTVSGLELFAVSDLVSISGAVASGVYVDNYSLTHRTLDPMVLNIRNHMDGWAIPNVLFKYTGVYDVDRNILISPDYATAYNKGDARWLGLDDGFTLPELGSFERGVFVDTKVEDRNVVLQDSAREGSWRTPVIDTENKAVAAYIYSQGDVDVYVRASDTPPPMVNFLIVTTDNSHRWLMYDHKRIYIDSQGDVIGSNECCSPEADSKIWRWADHDWAGTDLMYTGAINELGTACFVAPGYLECADISPEQEWEMPEYWYNCAVCKLEDSSEWKVGTTISGLPYGEGVSVLLTKAFPVDGSNGFFCFSITSDENVGMSALNLSFHQDGVTRGSYPLLTMQGSVSPTSKVDVAYDYANNGWWVYLGYKLYKVDPGSINNIRIFREPELVVTVSGNTSYYTQVNVPDTMQGYIWMKDVYDSWKGIVSIPSQDYSYFWAFNNKNLYLYEERYEQDEPDLVLRATIDTGYQVESGFLELHQGSCDSKGNIWMLDIAQERVIRVSLQKALVGDPRAVEYENQIAGVVGVWAHPTDDTCYMLITDEPEHQEQDIIRMVHVNQRWGSQGKYVCAVPGFYSKSYKYGVNFVGKAFAGGVIPHSEAEVWGLDRYEVRGDTNSSINYATPIMSSDEYGDFKVEATSYQTGKQPYKAFNQHTVPYGDVNESTNCWQASYIGIDYPSIMFVFDEPIVINKYALAVYWSSYSASTGLISYQTGQFPSKWELYGVKDEYADDPDVLDDSNWDLLDYRIDVVCPMGYIYGDPTKTCTIEEWNPWTEYFTFPSYKARKAYRFKSLRLQYLGEAGATSPYPAIGQIKFVQAEEKLPWVKYSPGRSFPRGRYAQLRMDLSRRSEEESSPRIERVRIPTPIELQPVPKGKDVDIALKTTLNKVTTPGAWDTKLRVWWRDEEI